MVKKKKTRKGNFTDRVKTQIAWDCKDICAYLECDKKLVRTKITLDQENAGWFQGHIAHIYPASPTERGGHRYDEKVPLSFIKSRENGIFLCTPHHDEIDDKENKDKYTAKFLMEMRKIHMSSVKDQSKVTKSKPQKFITDSRNMHKSLLKQLLKNYLIKYYTEVGDDAVDPKTGNIVSTLIDKLVELGDAQSTHFRDQNKSIKHNRMTSTMFAGGRAEFEKRVRNRDFLPITRNLTLKVIRQGFESELKKYEFLKEEYRPDLFVNSLNTLINLEIISTSGPPWEDSGSLTEWEVVDPERLEEFVHKKSFNYILRDLIN